MHGDEQNWVDEAIRTNWVSTFGANINAVEEQIAEYVGVKYAVGLSAGTAALHLATKQQERNCMDRHGLMRGQFGARRCSAVM